MAWTSPRTWVTGEQLTSGQLNTYIRDNPRYLHGDDGPITLVGELRVPALVVGGKAYGAAPVATNSVISQPIPATPGVQAALTNPVSLTPGGNYLVIARAAVEVPDANDAGFRAEIILKLLSGTPAVETPVDTATPTLPAHSGSPAHRTELTLAAFVQAPASAPQVYLVGRKTGGTGLTVGRGLSLVAYPF